jgi:hypothetical protein
MTVDCKWVDQNLEALCCDGLSEEESRLARAHVENCMPCRRELQALNAIDPLIKSYFRRELEIARRPRVVQRARILGLGGAAAAVAVALLFFVVRTPEPPSVVAPAVQTNTTPVASAEPPAPVKEHEPREIQRAKPSPEPSVSPDRQPPLPAAIPPNALDFLVTDPAGYSHTVDEYRGRVVVIAVWSREQAQSIASIERLYRANADNPRLRFLGISNERFPRPANTTFPVLYNQGSKLFGAHAGEFVLLDENGTIVMRGSLLKDLESLTRALREK